MHLAWEGTGIWDRQADDESDRLLDLDWRMAPTGLWADGKLTGGRSLSLGRDGDCTACRRGEAQLSSGMSALAVLMHDMMTSNLDQIPVPVTGQDDARMRPGHGSFGQELWLGLFSVVGRLEHRREWVKLAYSLPWYVNTGHSYDSKALREFDYQEMTRETRGGKTFWLKYQYVLFSPIFLTLAYVSGLKRSVVYHRLGATTWLWDLLVVPFGRGTAGGFSALWRSLGLLQEPVRPVQFFLCPVIAAEHTLLTSARIQIGSKLFSWEIGICFCKYRCVRSFFSSFAIRLVC